MRDRQCALNHDATESLSLSQMCHKQTDDGPLVDIEPVYRRLAVTKFTKSTM